MKHKGFLSIIATACILASIITGSGCANIIPPQGGPRDSLPPVLVRANPGDSSRNFTGNKITFTFDEFVDVQNVQQSMVVSPLPKISPQVDFRLNTVTIKLKDTLESNTTYSINFGDAIKDFNEGNALKNFTYTFSTGRYIDSLELTGKVILAENGKIDTTLIIMLHTNPDDSAVVKDKPRYIAKLDGSGGFRFKNLPQKNFYIYALKDEGNTLRYLDDKQLFAFADKPVVPSLTPGDITLYAYAVKPATATPVPVVNPGNRPGRGRNQGGDNRLKYTTNLANNQQDLLGDFIMSFDLPLRSFDSTKIRLYTDSAFNPALAYSFKKDSTNKKIILAHNWKPNTTYQLIMDKDFAEDTSGRKLLKTDTLSFITKKTTDYGSLQLKFRNLDMARNPVLLFVNGEVITRSIPLTGPSYSIAAILPGEYELRILYDDNKNGVWDPGKFFGQRKQPEKVQPFERKINVKPAWQNEFELTL